MAGACGSQRQSDARMTDWWNICSTGSLGAEVCPMVGSSRTPKTFIAAVMLVATPLWPGRLANHRPAVDAQRVNDEAGTPADGTRAAITMIGISARPACSSGKMLHHLRAQAEGPTPAILLRRMSPFLAQAV
jgi:hypothetical protein